MISGGMVSLGSQPTIYSVRLADPAEDLVSIAVRIDGVTSYPLTAADIGRLRLYADANGNGILEPGTDTFLGEETAVTVGATTTVSDPVPSEALGPFGIGKWFFVSITFNPSAIDKSFTVGAPSNNIAADAPPPGPPYVTADGGIAAGASVRIWTPRDVPPIPVGGEWIAGLAFVGYGVYRLLRRRSVS